MTATAKRPTQIGTFHKIRWHRHELIDDPQCWRCGYPMDAGDEGWWSYDTGRGCCSRHCATKVTEEDARVGVRFGG